MIISHKNGFIFLRPVRVAGTSVELNLSKHCGSDDIITRIINLGSSYDEFQFTSKSSKNSKDYWTHIDSHDVRMKVDRKTWNNYFKFTIVRNPWDQTISEYWWNKAKLCDENAQEKFSYKSLIKLDIFRRKDYKFDCEEFKNFITKHVYNHDNFYFDKDESPLCDFFMMFENIDDDYREVCERLQIPHEPLQRTKNIPRKHDCHYSKYYDHETMKIIEKKFKRQIDYFGYKFGD